MKYLKMMRKPQSIQKIKILYEREIYFMESVKKIDDFFRSTGQKVFIEAEKMRDEPLDHVFDIMKRYKWRMMD